MLKQGIKTTLNLFKHMHYPNFHSVQTLCKCIAKAYSLFDVKKVRSLWRRVWTLCLRSRPPLCNGWGSSFECSNVIAAIFLFKRNMAETDVYHTHAFCSMDCDFSFCKAFLHWSWRLKVRKNKSLSKQSKQSLLLFFIFWLIGLSFKTQLKTEF